MPTADHNSRALRVPLSILFLFVLAAFAHGQTAPSPPAKGVQPSSAPAAAAPSPDAAKPDASKPDGSGYVGAETCKTCHEEIYNNWAKTPHWKTTLNTKGGPSKQGCEG